MRAALVEARRGGDEGEVPDGAADPKVGAVESVYRLLDDGRLNREVIVTGGVLADEYAALLKEFFQARRGP
jgi:tRNA(adenine34) deaminase